MPDAPPNPALPLQGLTILAVEDSRYAADALRLMAQRLGARLRRAEGLGAARRHLALYRPDVVLVDLGLPDGGGEDLIRDLAADGGPPAVAISGDPAGRGPALAAGAAAFVEKPLGGLEAFRDLVLAQAGRRAPGGPAGDALPAPDPLALEDDLRQAARMLDRGPDAAGRRYLARFVAGLARGLDDAPLASAAAALADDPAAAPAVAALVARRLAALPAAFVR